MLDYNHSRIRFFGDGDGLGIIHSLVDHRSGVLLEIGDGNDRVHSTEKSTIKGTVCQYDRD